MSDPFIKKETNKMTRREFIGAAMAAAAGGRLNA